VGDANEVRDAIGCLLDNALKYRDTTETNAWVVLRMSFKKPFAIVEVQDNGLGVPKTMRTKIFQRFQRVEGPNRGKSGGHGLGLAQVADVARLHNGSVECAATRQKGALFVLRLPG